MEDDIPTDMEIFDALQSAVVELQRLYNIHWPEYAGKIGEPNRAIIAQGDAVLRQLGRVAAPVYLATPPNKQGDGEATYLDTDIRGALEGVLEWLRTGKVDGVGFDEPQVIEDIERALAKAVPDTDTPRARGVVGLMLKALEGFLPVDYLDDFDEGIPEQRAAYAGRLFLDLAVPAGDDPPEAQYPSSLDAACADTGLSFVIAVGDAFDGLSLYGPFSDFSAAQFAAQNFTCDPWWVVDVRSIQE